MIARDTYQLVKEGTLEITELVVGTCGSDIS